MFRSLFLTVTFCCACSAAFSQTFVSSDNFSANTGTTPSAAWQVSYTPVFSTDTNINGRLEYTSTQDPADLVASQTSWNLAASKTSDSWNDSWVATVDAHNSVTGANSFARAYLELFNPQHSVPYPTFNISLRESTTAGGLTTETIRALNTPHDDGSGQTFADFTVAVPTDVKLRMAFDASTKIATASYSIDAGATFVNLMSVDIDNGATTWSVAPTSGFGVNLFSYSGNVDVASGQLYYDNFSMTAVPEPSTYAAIAGIGALGLAFWRKRQGAARSAA